MANMPGEFGYHWHAVSCNVGAGPCSCKLPNRPEMIRIDIVVVRNGTHSIRRGVTPGELRELLAELYSLSNSMPMTFVGQCPE